MTRIVVIGAGIAGLSCAAEAARDASVTVLEAEAQPGYHSSGRSAATYIEPYLNATVNALTVASKSFFTDPPSGFSDHPLGTPRADLMIADAASAEHVEPYLARWRDLCPGVREISRDEALAMVPVLREEAVARAVSDPNVMDLDVHGLLEGYRRALLARGGKVIMRAAVSAIERSEGAWCLATAAGEFRADVLVDAAGAWGDRVAALAGVKPLGLVPKRRTAVLFTANGYDVARWPIVHEAQFRFYFKPDAGRLMLSPADATPSEPCDAQPEEWDVAVAVDRFEAVAKLRVARIEHKWAGLRSFVDDNRPVVGFDPEVDGFFWLVGQGGFGVQTCPAMSRLVASLLAARGMPDDLAGLGLRERDVSPGRLRGP